MHDYGLIHPENLQTWASAQELSGTFMVDPSTLLGVPYASPWLGIVTIIKKDINNAYGLYIFNYHDNYCCMSNAGKWTEPWVKLTPNKYPSNPNLLDNWYFINPVNQRGQTEYTTNYAIDRWWLQDSTSLNVVEGGVNVIGKWDIEQFFEKALPNGTYTLSLLYKDKIGSDPLRLIAANRSSGDVAQKLTKDASGLLSITFTSGKCDKIVAGFAGSADNVATFVAIKLEFGDTQTLAHKEGDKWVLNEIPDYGEQLSRCQRYCKVYPAETMLPCVAFGKGNGWYASAILPFDMRTNPVNNLSTPLSAILVDLDSGDDIPSTISNWGLFNGGQKLRISPTSGSSDFTQYNTYSIQLKEKLVLSADL